MLQDSLDALGLGRFGFHFKWHTFAFHPDEEVQLKARVLQEVVQALLLLVKSVCHQILEDGAFESSQVALQDIRPGPRAQHLDEQTDICRVNLEHIVFGIAFHRETGNIGIVAAADNAGVFQPLKRAKIGFTSSAGLNLAVLEFLVLLGQLLGDGIEEKVVNLGLQDKVLFLGNRNDVADLYNVMDILLLPSHYEGLPVVGVEAQANGLKCIMSDQVTEECRLTDNVYFISINQKARKWVDEIVKDEKKRNREVIEKIKRAGFDIRESAKKLNRKNYWLF